MQFGKLMVMAGCSLVFTGCAPKDIREGLYHGMYEGARIENRKELSPGDRSANREMEYNQYSNERKGRMEEDR